MEPMFIAKLETRTTLVDNTEPDLRGGGANPYPNPHMTSAVTVFWFWLNFKLMD